MYIFQFRLINDFYTNSWRLQILLNLKLDKNKKISLEKLFLLNY